MICDIYIFNRNWVDTRWQQYSTHLHTNNTQNTENGKYIIKKLKIHNNKKLNNLITYMYMYTSASVELLLMEMIARNLKCEVV
jgi:hypothetical protein